LHVVCSSRQVLKHLENLRAGPVAIPFSSVT